VWLNGLVPVLACGLALAAPDEGAAQPVTVQVTFTNLAPIGGTYVTPVWFGFHDGGFDIADLGQNAAGTFVESLAEDGVLMPTPGVSAPTIMPAFTASGRGFAQGALMGPGSTLPDGSPRPMGPVAPGQTVSMQVTLDPSRLTYFSFGTMVIPSNDFFVANLDPMAHLLFDGSGAVRPLDFVVAGSDVLDAGTEANTESMQTTAFFPGPNLGQSDGEGRTIQNAGGYIPGGPILTYAPNGVRVFGNAQFTAPGYRIGAFSVAVVPEPSTWALLGTGLLAVGGMARRRRG
jgi:hypothetical protein